MQARTAVLTAQIMVRNKMTTGEKLEDFMEWTETHTKSKAATKDTFNAFFPAGLLTLLSDVEHLV